MYAFVAPAASSQRRTSSLGRHTPPASTAPQTAPAEVLNQRQRHAAAAGVHQDMALWKQAVTAERRARLASQSSASRAQQSQQQGSRQQRDKPLPAHQQQPTHVQQSRVTINQSLISPAVTPRRSEYRDPMPASSSSLVFNNGRADELPLHIYRDAIRSARSSSTVLNVLSPPAARSPVERPSGAVPLRRAASYSALTHSSPSGSDPHPQEARRSNAVASDAYVHFKPARSVVRQFMNEPSPFFVRKNLYGTLDGYADHALVVQLQNQRPPSTQSADPARPSLRETQSKATVWRNAAPASYLEHATPRSVTLRQQYIQQQQQQTPRSGSQEARRVPGQMDRPTISAGAAFHRSASASSALRNHNAMIGSGNDERRYLGAAIIKQREQQQSRLVGPPPSPHTRDGKGSYISVPYGDKSGKDRLVSPHHLGHVELPKRKARDAQRRPHADDVYYEDPAVAAAVRQQRLYESMIMDDDDVESEAVELAPVPLAANAAPSPIEKTRGGVSYSSYSVADPPSHHGDVVTGQQSADEWGASPPRRASAPIGTTTAGPGAYASPPTQASHPSSNSSPTGLGVEVSPPTPAARPANVPLPVAGASPTTGPQQPQYADESPPTTRVTFDSRIVSQAAPHTTAALGSGPPIRTLLQQLALPAMKNSRSDFFQGFGSAAEPQHQPSPAPLPTEAPVPTSATVVVNHQVEYPLTAFNSSAAGALPAATAARGTRMLLQRMAAKGAPH